MKKTILKAIFAALLLAGAMCNHKPDSHASTAPAITTRTGVEATTAPDRMTSTTEGAVSLNTPAGDEPTRGAGGPVASMNDGKAVSPHDAIHDAAFLQTTAPVRPVVRMNQVCGPAGCSTYSYQRQPQQAPQQYQRRAILPWRR